METEGKVSIWLYNCKSKDALNEYIDLIETLSPS